MKVTVAYVTKRFGGLDILSEFLLSQTIWPELVAANDVEIILVDENARNPARQDAARHFSSIVGESVDTIFVHPADYEPRRYGKLSRSNNTWLNMARGTYVFMVNDYIFGPPHTLASLLSLAERNPNALLTCASHHASIPTLDHIGDPEGPFTIFKEPFKASDWPADVPTKWRDPRVDEPERTLPAYAWEASCAMARVQVLRDAGGWHESFDGGIGFDNTEVTFDVLTKIKGSQVIFLSEVVTYSLNHDGLLPNPPDQQAYETINGHRFASYVRDANLHGTPIQMPAEMAPSVAFWLPTIGQWPRIDPLDPMGKPLGGRETAFLHIARELARRKWHVGIYAPLTVPSHYDPGMTWHNAQNSDAEHLSNYDVVVSMDDAELFRHVKAKLNVFHSQFAAPAAPIGRLDRKIDAYVLLTYYQQQSMRERDPVMDADKCVLIGNGVDLARYDQPIEKVPGRFIYSSSPDRGLHHLLRMWPILKAKHPHITLKVFYPMDALMEGRWQHWLPSEWARTIDEGLTLPGVEYVGPVDQATLAREQLAAAIMVYPCDPSQATETWCITALECAAARTPMLLGASDCLPDVYGKVAYFGDVPILDSAWIDAISRMVEDSELRQRNVEKARAFAEEHTWSHVGERWAFFLRERLKLGSDRAQAVELVENVSNGLLRAPVAVGA